MIPQKERGVTLVGDYRARWMAHDGSNRPQSPFRANSAIGSAKANMADANRRFEQRLRLGFDARLNEFTNLKVIGSATGMEWCRYKLDSILILKALTINDSI